MNIKLLLHSVVALCFLASNVAAKPGLGDWGKWDIRDVFNSSQTIIKGIGKEVINRIPTPNDLFHVSKQVLFGLPEVAVFQTIGQLCKLIFLVGFWKDYNSKQMHFCRFLLYGG